MKTHLRGTTAALLCLTLSAGCAAHAGPRPGGDSTSAASRDPLALPAERPLTAGFVIVDGVYNTELIAPWDVFEHARHHTGERPGIEVLSISPDGEPVITAEGLRILPDHGFADAPPIDILVVPSAEGSRDRDLDNGALIDFVRRRSESARFVMSLCWGAFVLARAGLLDGRACTTFPRDYRRFAEAFPEADLRVNVSYVHDGRLLTSEGGARSYLAAMYLVELLYGQAVAAGVGRGLLIPWPPPAGQAPPAILDPSMRRAGE